ncbi:MAG: DUF1349 domain-containing protein [Pseudomonadota bacterium]
MTSEVNSWEAMSWLHEPHIWNIESDGSLTAKSGDKTDFWQRTFYGFQRDDGHALLANRTGDFTASLTTHAAYTELYDQCGFMLRVSPEKWVKFGIEFTHGETHLSCVVTDSVSDWSAAPIALDGPLSLRMTRLGEAVLCHYLDAGTWRMARLLPWPTSSSEVSVGPYLCSPEREGFEARFSNFRLTEPLQTTL